MLLQISKYRQTIALLLSARRSSTPFRTHAPSPPRLCACLARAFPSLSSALAVSMVSCAAHAHPTGRTYTHTQSCRQTGPWVCLTPSEMACAYHTLCMKNVPRNRRRCRPLCSRRRLEQEKRVRSPGEGSAAVAKDGEVHRRLREAAAVPDDDHGDARVLLLRRRRRRLPSGGGDRGALH